jgi:His/Glu/Gln/Arg/opine family amino acid ABC transporter permease subunit
MESRRTSVFRKRLILLALAMIFIISACFIAVSSKEVLAEDSTASQQTLDDFEHAVIGVQTGTTHEAIAKERFPDAEIKNYTSSSDLILSLQQGKIDGFVKNIFFYAVAKRDVAGLEMVPEAIESTEKGIAFNKSERGEELKAQMDELLAELQADGTLDEMYDVWMGETEPDVTLDFSTLTGENGTIKYVMCAEQKPFSYMKDGEYVGYDVELMLRFCEKYGYELQIENVSFSSMVPGIVSGKYDVAAAGIDISPERAESVLFSEPYLENEVVMITWGGDNGGSFWDSVKDGFEKTFIRENRWQMILEGIGTTLLITVLSAAAGTALGFGLYMLSRSGKKLILGICAVYTRIIAGLPAVVLLMILFYVVFAKAAIDGVWVASIGFALITGAFVYKNLALTVSGVDKGQTEGALALGYTDKLAFFKIVLPQAMRQFMPAYQGEIVSLVKSTAIVGYIAVEDLTKVSDIIRSNTYEAFFPLIATAIIYFLLTWIIALVIGRIDMKFDWKRRNKSNILKGVKL